MNLRKGRGEVGKGEKLERTAGPMAYRRSHGLRPAPWPTAGLMAYTGPTRMAYRRSHVLPMAYRRSHGLRPAPWPIRMAYRRSHGLPMAYTRARTGNHNNGENNVEAIFFLVVVEISQSVGVTAFVRKRERGLIFHGETSQTGSEPDSTMLSLIHPSIFQNALRTPPYVIMFAFNRTCRLSNFNDSFRSEFALRWPGWGVTFRVAENINSSLLSLLTTHTCTHTHTHTNTSTREHTPARLHLSLSLSL